MLRDDVEQWLDAYGKAWSEGDPKKITQLFSKSAAYRETPFDTAMVGREAIAQYWHEGATTAQTDVEFFHQLWAIHDNTAVAGWQARFVRKATGVKVELDGVFKLHLEKDSDGLLCTSLEEWWHRRET